MGLSIRWWVRQLGHSTDACVVISQRWWKLRCVMYFGGPETAEIGSTGIVQSRAYSDKRADGVRTHEWRSLYMRNSLALSSAVWFSALEWICCFLSNRSSDVVSPDVSLIMLCLCWWIIRNWFGVTRLLNFLLFSSWMFTLRPRVMLVIIAIMSMYVGICHSGVILITYFEAYAVFAPFQARCISAQTADRENNRWLVGTLSLRYENEVSLSYCLTSEILCL